MKPKEVKTFRKVEGKWVQTTREIPNYQNKKKIC